MKTAAADRPLPASAPKLRGSPLETRWHDLTADANALSSAGAHSEAIGLYAKAFDEARRLFEIARSRDRKGEEAVCILVASAVDAARNLEAWGAPQDACLHLKAAVALLIETLRSGDGGSALKSAAAQHLPRLLAEVHRGPPEAQDAGPDAGSDRAELVRHAKAAALDYWKGLAT